MINAPEVAVGPEIARTPGTAVRTRRAATAARNVDPPSLGSRAGLPPKRSRAICRTFQKLSPTPVPKKCQSLRRRGCAPSGGIDHRQPARATGAYLAHG